MNQKLTVSCECTKVLASVNLSEQRKPTRMKCYCIDCQTYAQHLNAAETQLDTNGGTDILQLSPATLSIQYGKELLGNLNLKPDGIYRWYSTCCNTPLFNTPSKVDMPYLGLITTNITKISQTTRPAKGKKSQSTKVDNENRDNALNDCLGPVKYGVCAGKQHPMSTDWPVAKGFGLRGILGTLRNMARWRLRGDHKKSVLIDAETAEPLVPPTLISLEERQAARSKI